jgi:glycosyltransferase involved in cell wall biosynthesis
MSRAEISVVMASRGAAPELHAALESLVRQKEAPETEILVAAGAGDESASMARREFPQVRLVECATGAPAPALLYAGLSAATGRIVVLTDACCQFPPDWLRKVARAHESEFGVIGGAVAYAGDGSPANWASFLADYGAFAPSARKAESALLPGIHVSYKREVLGQALASRAGQFRKVFAHWELQRQGAKFLFTPEVVVEWARRETFGECAQRFFAGGRSFAATRAEGMSRGERLARVATSPALPVVLMLRKWPRVAGQRGYTLRAILALPWMAAYFLAWSAGEGFGYWRGPDRRA